MPVNHTFKSGRNNKADSRSENARNALALKHTAVLKKIKYEVLARQFELESQVKFAKEVEDMLKNQRKEGQEMLDSFKIRRKEAQKQEKKDGLTYEQYKMRYESGITSHNI